MIDTDKSDPILKQIPLIKNPTFQPPRPITLSNNYNKLIPTLSTTVIPPKLNISDTEIDSWLNEIRSLRQQIINKQINSNSHSHSNHNNGQSDKYEKWIREQSNKIAPGFNYTVMQPQKPIRIQDRKLISKEEVEAEEAAEEVESDNDNDNEFGYDEMNELDRIFGKTKLN
ncbi:hypothetical protein CD36_30160 [Candida dubliniensis CD36]|uniref:Uncharacterized protein n=1 Tax=Candida dubliniensis (strain CD36 / ATCC MYA-646 / CBS 7987 / NCPF 3949 / NRRL Y-17841) TaxID=573826 RepID=B9WLS4_CANDC|nr:hypothetical protein CD36_30160 [Candida dubliniensis CD36]CAX40036.1 hypothetical protein CD36_30160 [Candida dubliniensis CD36]